MIEYLNYDYENIDEELEKIKNSKEARIVLEPNNKKCLFILGMLFANNVKIEILNEADLDLTATGKSFSLMSYVWSKLMDNTFPLNDYSDVVSEVDQRIENVKRLGISFNPIISEEGNNKIFLICPVRNAS